MKVHELMTHTPERCTPDTDLAAAAMIMWRTDCGAVPVVSEGDQPRVLGMITDRDICMAVATRHRRAEEMRVGEVMTGRLVATGPDEDLDEALDLMRLEQVRRLPVVDAEDSLIGILSINDVILEAAAANGPRRASPTSDEVVNAMKGICEHHAGQLVRMEELVAL
jgi:CBS domain-containing protein